ncbi:hypothetical protein DIJ64_01650 [Mycobacterium leprae]|uniref:Uncharacterized protein n=1 Tax=Mycobacterium leprae TaxID=1769 RepID=A0AAD0KSR7_MYCLR|nr:hypothetical protein [Mycobacterium leprae]AWV47268.1 hypothetical protein DIJ64_01650 [Mycobacterium leprae]
MLGAPIVTLPGNAISALVSFEVLIRTALTPGYAPTESAATAPAHGAYRGGKFTMQQFRRELFHPADY